MGGIIEDYIFERLKDKRLSLDEININLGIDKRSKSTLNYHLNKMSKLRQLDREKGKDNKYYYFNPLMYKNGN
jgi:hypothetical protein